MDFKHILVAALALGGVFTIAEAINRVPTNEQTSASSKPLVIITTNDTHSQIDPTDEPNGGLGGIARRKVVIDSIRAARTDAEVMLIDLGDIVQGTLYFNLYGGKVENEMMNALGYDIRILGNHEFDNGVDSLAAMLRDANAIFLSTNYDLRETPLAEQFKPYLIKQVGDKRIGFIAINLRPKGMISEGNYDGVEYYDALKAASATAWHLKHNERVDKVIALTHIGYAPSGTGTSDTELAAATTDIDLILGGHSHTLIDPSRPDHSVPWILNDADDNECIIVTQSGKSGRYIGMVEVNLDTDDAPVSKVIRIDSRLDDRVDPALLAQLGPYRHGVDSIMNRKVARTAIELDKESAELSNFVSDFIAARGAQLVSDGRIDLAIANKGGIRRGLPKGNITEGQVQSMLPFNNHVVVLDLKGSDLLEAFGIMTLTDGNGLSKSADVVYYRPEGTPNGQQGEIVVAEINGKPIDPDATYRVATIDYLSNGGDYLTPLTHGTVVAQSPGKLYEDLLEALATDKAYRKAIRPESRVRMRPTVLTNQK